MRDSSKPGLFGRLLRVIQRVTGGRLFGNSFITPDPSVEELDRLTRLKHRAEAGDAKAQLELGIEYQKGKIVTRDLGEAIRWYRKGAEQGHCDSQIQLGIVLCNKKTSKGSGRHEGIMWYERAAEQGSTVAQMNLAAIYLDGEGVPKNPAKALELYRRAADAGNPGSFFMLGQMYWGGKGVSEDHAEAYKWFSLGAMHAKSNDVKSACRTRIDFIVRKMSSSEVTEAERRLREVLKEN